jgi:hypothetical protein
MEAWVREYREQHPAANAWAQRSRKFQHLEATQGRIFRLAEQLRVGLDWPNVAPLFAVLEALDDAVDAETSPTARPTPTAAAAAGVVAYKLLFGKPPALQGHGWPQGFDRVEPGELELATTGLRAQGFDPIVFDGIDPAAYVWALFEMRQRAADCDEVMRLHQHAPSLPRCLAVVPERVAERLSPRFAPATRAFATSGR